MMRLTVALENGRYLVEKNQVIYTPIGYEGNAIEKLGKLQNLVEDLNGEPKTNTQ